MKNKKYETETHFTNKELFKSNGKITQKKPNSNDIHRVNDKAGQTSPYPKDGKGELFDLTMCAGANGCPLAIIDTYKTAEKLADEINKYMFEENLENKDQGIVLSHQMFKVAVAGCPNACSNPSIMDFGVIGSKIPEQGEVDCIECKKCIKSCKEDAIIIKDKILQFNYEKCVFCGDCIKVCPTNVIEIRKEGYRILVGGKLGRHPQLAYELEEVYTEDSINKIFGRCIKQYKINDNNRIGGIINRMGWDNFKKILNK